MKYAGEMGSGDTIYIPSFIKIGSGIHTQAAWCIMRLLLFFQNKESRLKYVQYSELENLLEAAT
jgi:hypothetical protein